MGALAAQPDKKKTRYYLMHNFYLRNGTQVERIHSFLRDTVLPATSKIHRGPVIVLEALVAPHMPQVTVIAGMESLEQYQNLRAALQASEAYNQGLDKWEKGPEPPTEHYSTQLLEATDYSPEIIVPEKPPAASRIFELRVYHSPSAWQLKALHERFAGPEIKIFHRVGVHPILYSSTLFGPNKPNLVYLTPFDSLDAREKAWAKFGADPEWIKVRKESIERSGQISSVIQISLHRAAPYSPVR